jgi:four helix bundle protein
MVEEELDETIYWLDLIGATELIKPELLVELDKEAKELLSIIVKSIITKRKKLTASQL